METKYRVSQYNLYLPMSKSDDVLLVQGIRGAFDIVDQNVSSVLQKLSADSGYFTEEEYGLPHDAMEALNRRGYITGMSPDEEFDFLSQVSQAINERGKRGVSITLLPTYNCNFRCEYCFERNLQNKGHKWMSAKMSPEIVDAVFVQIEKFKAAGRKVEGIYLFGGEPLLKTNKEIVHYICEKSKQMELPISCVSNGYDLDQYVDLINEFAFNYVQITIDGIATEHDKRRYLAGGQGSFDRIISNVGLAVEKGVSIVLRTNVNKKNIPEMKKLIALYQEKGWIGKPNFKYYFKSTLRCYDEVKDAYSDVELIEELSKELGISDAGVFQFNSIYGALSDKLNYMLKNNTFAPLRSGYCGANMGMYTVDPFGDIYPCWDVLTEESEKIGFVDLEKGEFVFNENHDRWKCRTVDKIPDCKGCPYLLFCGGGCAAQAKVMHNDMNKVFCDDFQLLFDQVAVQVCESFLESADA